MPRGVVTPIDYALPNATTRDNERHQATVVNSYALKNFRIFKILQMVKTVEHPKLGIFEDKTVGDFLNI